MHTVDFESFEFRESGKKKIPNKSEAKPAEDFAAPSHTKSETDLDTLNNRIEEIQASPLWKKLFLRSALEKELNDLYRKRRELGGSETQPYQRDPSPQERLWETFRNTDLATEERMRAFLVFVKNIIPELLWSADGEAGGSDELAIDPTKYRFTEEFLGDGTESEVYLLESLDESLPSLVLKIHCPSEIEEPENEEDAKDQNRARTQRLLENAKYNRADYEKIRRWYADIPGLVPEEFSYIGKDPRYDMSALFTLQEYFGKRDELVDVIEEKDRFEYLLENNRQLRNDFIRFMDITWSIGMKENLAIDFKGQNNISVIPTTNGPRLIILDPHDIFPFDGDLQNRTYMQELKDLADQLRTISATNEENYRQAA